MMDTKLSDRTCAPDAHLSVTLISAASMRQGVWKGGATTEIAIFPPTSTYEARDFECRISSATVDSGGPFTKFAGFERILLLLHGDGVVLTVDSEKKVLNEPLQRISFSGTAETSAELLGGRVVDFNVIYRPGVKPAVIFAELSRTNPDFVLPQVSNDAKRHFDLLYVLGTPCALSIDGRAFEVNLGDCLQIERTSAAATKSVSLSAHGQGAAFLCVGLDLGV